jgi:hypothetical protein
MGENHEKAPFPYADAAYFRKYLGTIDIKLMD